MLCDAMERTNDGESKVKVIYPLQESSNESTDTEGGSTESAHGSSSSLGAGAGGRRALNRVTLGIGSRRARTSPGGIRCTAGHNTDGADDGGLQVTVDGNNNGLCGVDAGGAHDRNGVDAAAESGERGCRILRRDDRGLLGDGCNGCGLRGDGCGLCGHSWGLSGNNAEGVGLGHVVNGGRRLEVRQRLRVKKNDD